MRLSLAPLVALCHNDLITSVAFVCAACCLWQGVHEAHGYCQCPDHRHEWTWRRDRCVVYLSRYLQAFTTFPLVATIPIIIFYIAYPITAKNVILAGVKSVTLWDRADVTARDLGSQFYLSEADIGKNRADACRDQLQELNTAVTVASSSADLNEQFLSTSSVVVATQMPLAEAIRIDNFCHKADIPFIKADIRGVFASVFCDFGPAFQVHDVDGEEPHTGIVAGITPGMLQYQGLLVIIREKIVLQY